MTTAHNNQPNYRGRDGGRIGEDAQPSGNAGGGAFDRSEAGRVGRANIQNNTSHYKINHFLSCVKELNKILCVPR